MPAPDNHLLQNVTRDGKGGYHRALKLREDRLKMRKKSCKILKIILDNLTLLQKLMVWTTVSRTVRRLVLVLRFA